MKHIHAMEYYSVMKKNELLACAAPQLDLEGIMLSEIGQKEKNKYQMISFNVWNLKKKKCINITETDP